MADLNKAGSFARDMLRQHGLDKQGWRFDWNNNKSRNGVCRYGPKKIEASRLLSQVRTDEQVQQTIIHEVAHAIVGVEYKTVIVRGRKKQQAIAHGDKWLAKARSLGYTGSRCTNERETSQAISAVAPYAADCSRCGATIPRFKAGKYTEYMHNGCGGRIVFDFSRRNA